MQHLLRILECYEIGTRALTEDDFWIICEKEKILVLWSPEKFSFYFTVLGEHFIVLPKRRKGISLLFAMFHELAHCLMHSGDAPDVAFDNVCANRHDRREVEADAIALLALMPRGHELFLNDCKFAAQLHKERLRLMLLYDI